VRLKQKASLPPTALVLTGLMAIPIKREYFPHQVKKKYSRIVFGVLAKDPRNRAIYGTI
jgi:hypothetical protein